MDQMVQLTKMFVPSQIKNNAEAEVCDSFKEVEKHCLLKQYVGFVKTSLEIFKQYKLCA